MNTITHNYMAKDEAMERPLATYVARALHQADNLFGDAQLDITHDGPITARHAITITLADGATYELRLKRTN